MPRHDKPPSKPEVLIHVYGERTPPPREPAAAYTSVRHAAATTPTSSPARTWRRHELACDHAVTPPRCRAFRRAPRTEQDIAPNSRWLRVPRAASFTTSCPQSAQPPAHMNVHAAATAAQAARTGDRGRQRRMPSSPPPSTRLPVTMERCRLNRVLENTSEGRSDSHQQVQPSSE